MLNVNQSIKGLTKTDIVKTYNTKIQYKNSEYMTLTLKPCTKLGIILHKILDQHLYHTKHEINILQGFETMWSYKL